MWNLNILVAINKFFWTIKCWLGLMDRFYLPNIGKVKQERKKLENSHTYTPAKSKIFQFSHSVSVERSLYNAYGTSTGKKHYVDRNIYMFMCVLTELYVRCTIFFDVLGNGKSKLTHIHLYIYSGLNKRDKNI